MEMEGQKRKIQEKDLTKPPGCEYNRTIKIYHLYWWFRRHPQNTLILSRAISLYSMRVLGGTRRRVCADRVFYAAVCTLFSGFPATLCMAVLFPMGKGIYARAALCQIHKSAEGG